MYLILLSHSILFFTYMKNNLIYTPKYFPNLKSTLHPSKPELCRTSLTSEGLDSDQTVLRTIKIILQAKFSPHA